MILLVLTWSPCRLCLTSRHVGYPLTSDCEVVALHLLANLNQPVVEELQCPARLQPKHLLEADALLHAHVNGVHADEPDHVLLAGRDGVGADVEGVVPVVRVVPEAGLALLQEHGVVEGEVAGEGREVGALGGHEEVVDPLVAVAHFEEDAEAERHLDALVDLGLGVSGDQTAFDDERVDELHLG